MLDVFVRETAAVGFLPVAAESVALWVGEMTFIVALGISWGPIPEVGIIAVVDVVWVAAEAFGAHGFGGGGVTGQAFVVVF